MTAGNLLDAEMLRKHPLTHQTSNRRRKPTKAARACLFPPFIFSSAESLLTKITLKFCISAKTSQRRELCFLTFSITSTMSVPSRHTLTHTHTHSQNTNTQQFPRDKAESGNNSITESRTHTRARNSTHFKLDDVTMRRRVKSSGGEFAPGSRALSKTTLAPKARQAEHTAGAGIPTHTLRVRSKTKKAPATTCVALRAGVGGWRSGV